MAEEIKDGNFVLCVGGDHALAFGSLAGCLKANPHTCIVWVGNTTIIKQKNSHCPINSLGRSANQKKKELPFLWTKSPDGVRN